MPSWWVMMDYDANGQATQPLFIEYRKAGCPVVRADFEMCGGGLGPVRFDADLNVTENYRIHIRAYPTPPQDGVLWNQATPGWVFRAFYHLCQFGDWIQHTERPIHPELLIPSPQAL
jgi:hypothetical protein